MKAVFQKLLVGLAIMMFAMPAIALGAGNTDMELLAEKVNIMKKYSECLEKYEGKEDVSEKCAPYKEASETFISK